MKRRNNFRPAIVRSGVVTLEVILTLAVTFPIAMGMFVLGSIACRNLYHLISTMCGSPYL